MTGLGMSEVAWRASLSAPEPHESQQHRMPVPVAAHKARLQAVQRGLVLRDQRLHPAAWSLVARDARLQPVSRGLVLHDRR